MLSDPGYYVREILQPLLARLEDEPDKIELAISICILISHFSEVIAFAKGKDHKTVRADLDSSDSAFSVLHAVSDATKHVEITSNTHGRYRGLKITDIVKSPAGAFSDGMYFDDDTTWDDESYSISVMMPTGHRYDLLILTRRAVQHLQRNFC